MIALDMRTRYSKSSCYETLRALPAKASTEIELPSPDMMEEKVNTFARFIPPENYYNQYFRTAGREPFYDPLGTSDSYYI